MHCVLARTIPTPEPADPVQRFLSLCFAVSLDGFRFFCVHALRIVDESANLIPFVWNGPQERCAGILVGQFAAGVPVRMVLLKARKMGFSTLIEAFLLWTLLMSGHRGGYVLAHDEATTEYIFGIARTMYDNLPADIRPSLKRGGGQTLRFAHNDSWIQIATAGSTLDISSGFTFQFGHATEVSKWGGNARDIVLAVQNAIGDVPYTVFVWESTAKGASGVFYEQWKLAESGTSSAIAFFAAWHELPKYAHPTSEADEALFLAWKAALLVDDLAESRRLQRALRLDDDEVALVHHYSLRLGQIRWYRWILVNKCQDNEDLRRQEYPSCAEEAFLASGGRFFPPSLVARLRASAHPPERGHLLAGSLLERVRFVPDPQGDIHVFAMPDSDHSYIVAVDASHGTGQDYAVAVAADRATGAQVAQWRSNVDDVDVQAERAVALARFYNDALVCPEVNGPGAAVIQEIRRSLRYHRIWRRHTYDTTMQTWREKIGWETTSKTKAMLLLDFRADLKHGRYVVHDRAALDELDTFVYLDGVEMRMGAGPGRHDDTVIANAIAAQMLRDLGPPPVRRPKDDVQLHELPPLERLWVKEGIMTARAALLEFRRGHKSEEGSGDTWLNDQEADA